MDATGMVVVVVSSLVGIILMVVLLVWFWRVVQPKISWSAILITAVLGTLSVLVFPTTLELMLSKSNSFASFMGVGTIEELVKLAIALLGITIINEEGGGLQEKLGVAFLAGLVFAVVEGVMYQSSFNHSGGVGVLLFLSRLPHIIWTLTMVEGYLQLRKRGTLGALLLVAPPVFHAMNDYGVVNSPVLYAIAVFGSAVLFYIGTRSLMDDIRFEKERREKAMKDAKRSIADNWFNKLSETAPKGDSTESGVNPPV